MTAPELTYAFYSQTHRGKLGQDAFENALPEATARTVALTGEDIPERCEEKWLHACSAMVDHVGGIGGAHRGVSSEHVGDTTLTYTDETALESDLKIIAPWLTGTGLLYAGLCCRGRRP